MGNDLQIVPLKEVKWAAAMHKLALLQTIEKSVFFYRGLISNNSLLARDPEI